MLFIEVILFKKDKRLDRPQLFRQKQMNLSRYTSITIDNTNIEHWKFMDIISY